MERENNTKFAGFGNGRGNKVKSGREMKIVDSFYKVNEKNEVGEGGRKRGGLRAGSGGGEGA
jgi:hypothetical protein